MPWDSCYTLRLPAQTPSNPLLEQKTVRVSLAMTLIFATAGHIRSVKQEMLADAAYLFYGCIVIALRIKHQRKIGAYDMCGTIACRKMAICRARLTWRIVRTARKHLFITTSFCPTTHSNPPANISLKYRALSNSTIFIIDKCSHLRSATKLSGRKMRAHIEPASISLLISLMMSDVLTCQQVQHG